MNPFRLSIALALALGLTTATAFGQARGREEKSQGNKADDKNKEEKPKTREEKSGSGGRRSDSGVLDSIIILTEPGPRVPREPHREFGVYRAPRLTFSREGVGICEISEDGEHFTVLTRNIEPGGFHPARAPRRGRIAYIVRENGQTALRTVGENLTRPHRLTDSRWGSADLPAWSPDDNNIAFVSRRDGNDEIYSVGSGGGKPRRLTDNPALDTQPTWSPDGKSIVFVSDRDGKPALWQMRPDGREPRKVAAVPEGIASDPVFSPDGRYLVACFEIEPGYRDLWRIDLTGKPPRRLTIESGDYRYPSFRPDSSKLAFSAKLKDGYALFVLPIDGNTEPMRVTSGANDLRPVWW